MWKNLQENSSTLNSLKQTTPSDRSATETAGIGDRSSIGKTPESGQKQIWGNLASQSRGMEGKLDTQGKENSTMFTSHAGASQSNNPGTYIPQRYKSMYQIREGVTADSTGVNSGVYKTTSATKNTGTNAKYTKGADTNNGGSCNCDGRRKKTALNESQLIGGLFSLVTSGVINNLLHQ